MKELLLSVGADEPVLIGFVIAKALDIVIVPDALVNEGFADVDLSCEFW